MILRENQQKLGTIRHGIIILWLFTLRISNII